MTLLIPGLGSITRHNVIVGGQLSYAQRLKTRTELHELMVQYVSSADTVKVTKFYNETRVSDEIEAHVKSLLSELDFSGIISLYKQAFGKIAESGDETIIYFVERLEDTADTLVTSQKSSAQKIIENDEALETVAIDDVVLHIAHHLFDSCKDAFLKDFEVSVGEVNAEFAEILSSSQQEVELHDVIQDLTIKPIVKDDFSTDDIQTVIDTLIETSTIEVMSVDDLSKRMSN